MSARHPVVDGTSLFSRVLLQPRVSVAQHKRCFRQDTFADRVEAGRRAWQQLLQAIQFETVNGIAGLRFDKRERDHPIEEKVIRIPARARQLRRGEDRKSTRLNSSHLGISYA